jgi:hypothetical protein
VRVSTFMLGPISRGKRLPLRALLRGGQTHRTLKHVRIKILLVRLVREDLARALPSPLGLQFLLSFFLAPVRADGATARRPAAVVGHDSCPDAKEWTQEWPLPALPTRESRALDPLRPRGRSGDGVGLPSP